MTLNDAAVNAIATLAFDAAEAERLDLGGYYVFRLGNQLSHVDLTGDVYRDAPRRRAGSTTVRDVASFLALWGKFADDDSEVYADRNSRAITGVLNAHRDNAVVDGARFGDHRIILQLRHSDAFAAWNSINGHPQSQTTFAEFIEDHRNDVRSPSAADLLELAQDFQATTKVTFRSGTQLKSGQKTINYVEQIDATAGKNGQLTIPDELQLGLPIFDGAQVADEVTARLRYRIDSGGRLALIVVLDQLADVINAAFEGVIAEIDAGVVVPILRGTPVCPF